MADAPLTPEDRDALAAELALGVLDGEERALALRLRLSDPAFAAAVAAWQERLNPLLERYPEQTPGEAMWHGIADRLDGRASPAVVVPIRRWTGFATAAAAMAAALALFVALRPLTAPAPEAPVAVAQLSGEAQGLQVLARYDGATAKLSLRSAGVQSGDKAPELWVIPADGKPRSLGLIAPAGGSTVDVPQPLRTYLSEGAVLAVTYEDRATAPHAAPSAAPVATGKISFI